MRIRTIKPGFITSQSMGHCCREARYLFSLLWVEADDAGRLNGNPRYLAHMLFPYDNDIEGQIHRWLRELEREGCIRQYCVDGQAWIRIENFGKHQKIDKPRGSVIPEAPSMGQHELPLAAPIEQMKGNETRN